MALKTGALQVISDPVGISAKKSINILARGQNFLNCSAPAAQVG